MSQHDDLIQSLTADLRPVHPAGSPDLTALLWLLGSTVYVAVLTALVGPLRPGALVQLVTVPRFFAEMAVGLLAFGLLAVCAFRAAIPGRLDRRWALVSGAVMILWLLQMMASLLWLPALQPSTAGARSACWLETILYALGPMLLGFVLTRRLYPLSAWKTTLCFSLVTGLLPAWYMQLACMYVMPHVIDHHILPGLVVGLAGSGLALLYRRDRRPPERALQR